MSTHVIEIPVAERDAWFDAIEAEITASGGIIRQSAPGLYVQSRPWLIAFHVELPQVNADRAGGQ